MDIEGFLHEYRQVRNRGPLSPRSKEMYGHYLQKLDEFLIASGIELVELTPEEFEEFLDGQPWGSSARYNALVFLKAFLRWLGEWDHPISKFSITRGPPAPRRTPKRKQILRLVESMDQRSVKGKRDYAITVLTLETGLRANEIATLQRDDIDLENLEFKIRVKGGGEWITPFPASVGDAMEKWLRARERIAQDSATEFFLAVGGTRRVRGNWVSAVGYPMTRHGVKELFYHLTESAGIGRYGPHAFRRAFCTQAVERNVNLRLIQIQGRWKSMRMVEHYSQDAQAEAFRDHFGGFGD